MTQAVFLNGVFESVLQEILNAQIHDPDLICFLQPYSPYRIVQLEKANPSVASPIPLYISTTRHLEVIGYTAMIVGWENKQDLSQNRLDTVNAAIQKHQPEEESVYVRKPDGTPCANLLSVKYLRPLQNPVSVRKLVKQDGSPVKPRKRAGNWTYVGTLPESDGVTVTIIKDQLDEELARAVEKALHGKKDKRQNRLAKAPVHPERLQVTSYAFRRNPDVVAEVLVLLRAKGKCESCKRDAPFLRASSGTPFLEIHHILSLADGGEDTVPNAQALCPNCHRKMHFGIRNAES